MGYASDDSFDEEVPVKKPRKPKSKKKVFPPRKPKANAKVKESNEAPENESNPDEPNTSTNAKPKVKRLKESATESNPDGQPSKSNFMDMNDDCIREIITYLDAYDLCLLSTQCRRLRNLTQFELFRRFPNETAKIKEFERNGYWFRYPGDNEFIVSFAQIKKLSISNEVSTAQAIEGLKEFFYAKEQSHVEEIHFEGCRSIRPAHGMALSKIVDETKSVTFNRCKILGEFYETILRYFTSMENLVLRQSLEMTCGKDEQINWLKQKYPNLKEFSWFFAEELPLNYVVELKMFFIQNPKIKHFSLYTKQIETLQRLEKADIRITQLYFRITRRGGVGQTLNYLKTMCRKDKSLRLHLIFEDNCRTELTSHLKLFVELNTNLRGLYLDKYPPAQSLTNAIAQCIHLKDLQVRHCKFIPQLIAALPKLENVYVARGMVGPTYQQILEMINQFTTQAPKLKNLFFRNSYLSFRDFNFNRLNQQRSQLPGATKMTFHVRVKSQQKIAELSNMQN
ncbi:hypothetical protein Bhyg_17768, partial [Pseudolycoriella hygida]